MKAGWRVVLAGILMTAVIGWMIADRLIVLANGHEIVVAVEPVDPTDLFRGEYVRLAYGFSRLPAPPGGMRDDVVYVVLKPEGERYVYDSADLSMPAVADGRVVLKGEIRSVYDDVATVFYGVEQYFVPQGHGGGIESGVQERRTDVVLAVMADGRVAIRSLRLDGKDVYREGLF